MPEFTAPSGAKVMINAAPWKNAKALKIAIERQANLKGIDFQQDYPGLIENFIRVDSSEEVDAALWPCLIRCTRNGIKIDETTFDELAARQDYYDIIIACIKENLSPLVESLFLKFAALGMKKQAPSTLESK